MELDITTLWPWLLGFAVALVLWNIIKLVFVTFFARNMFASLKDYGGGDLRRDRTPRYWFTGRSRR